MFKAVSRLRNKGQESASSSQTQAPQQQGIAPMPPPSNLEPVIVNGAAQLNTIGPTILSAADQKMRKATPEEAALTAKNYRLAKELSDLRVRHREETKNVNRLTMENMNLASRCREAIGHVAMLKKEVAAYKRAAAAGKLAPSRSFESSPPAEEKETPPPPQPILTPSAMPVLSKQHTGRALDVARDLEQMDQTLSPANDASNSSQGNGDINNDAKTETSVPVESNDESPGDLISPTSMSSPPFFPQSASPNLLARKGYNEEYPADLSASTKRIPSRQRVNKLQGFEESEDDVAESLGSGALKAAFGEQDENAFDASFDANFPDNFSATAPADASQNRGEGGDDQKDIKQVRRTENVDQEPRVKGEPKGDQLLISDLEETYNPFASSPPPSLPPNRSDRPSTATADLQPSVARGSSRSPTVKPNEPSSGNQQKIEQQQHLQRPQTRDPPGRNRTSGKGGTPIVKTSGAFAPTLVTSSATPTTNSVRGGTSVPSAASRSSGRSQSVGRFHFRTTSSPQHQVNSLPLGAASRSSSASVSSRSTAGSSAAGLASDGKANGATHSPKTNGHFRSPRSSGFAGSPASVVTTPRSESTPRTIGFSSSNGLGSSSSLDNRFRVAASPPLPDEKTGSDSARLRYEKAILAQQRSGSLSTLDANTEERNSRPKIIRRGSSSLEDRSRSGQFAFEDKTTEATASEEEPQHNPHRHSPSPRESSPHISQTPPSSSQFKKMEEDKKMETGVASRPYFAKRASPLDDQVKARKDLSARQFSSSAEDRSGGGPPGGEERKVFPRDYRMGSSPRNGTFSKSNSRPNLTVEGEPDMRAVAPTRESYNGKNLHQRAAQQVPKHPRDGSYSSVEEKKTEEIADVLQPATPTRLSVKDRVSMFSSGTSASPRSPEAEQARLGVLSPSRSSRLGGESPNTKHGKFLDAGDIPLVSNLRKPSGAGLPKPQPPSTGSRHLNPPSRLWGDEELDG